MSIKFNKKDGCLAALLFCLLTTVTAQDSLLQKRQTDSLANDKTATLLRKMDSTRVADSLRRALLLNEIDNLNGTETNRQREVLLKKLQEQQVEDSVRKALQLEELARLKSSSRGYPVTLFRDTLFYVYTGIGSFTPAERAEAIAGKIKKLYDDYSFRPDSLMVSLSDEAPQITYEDMVVMSINGLEALWFNKKPVDLANEYKTIIASAITKERSANSVRNILLKVSAVLLILAGIYLLIKVINKLFSNFKRKLIRLKETRLKGIRFKGYEFLDSNRQLRVLLFLLNTLRLIIIVISFYIALPLLFGVFPWTRGIAKTLLGWFTTPVSGMFNSIVHYLPSLFTIIVIGIITHYIIRFLNFIAAEIECGKLTVPGFYPDWARPTLNLVKCLLYAFSFIIIFPYLPGSDSPVFRGVSVFLGILFSLGSSSAIANAVAGLVITYMRPFKIGDRIKVGDIMGDVIEKSLLVTRILTIKNEEITIPNSTILSQHTVNYTSSATRLGLILHSTVTIGYDAPWKQVHELLINAALATRGILNEENKKPFVLQTSLDDFYISYQINAYTNEPQRMAAIYSELHQHIQDKFNEAGVEIMSPHYRAARDGNMTTVPESYLSKNYKAPAFNVQMNTSDKKEQ